MIAESANIIEYLLEHFGKESTLLPKRWREGEEGKVAGESEEVGLIPYYMPVSLYAAFGARGYPRLSDIHRLVRQKTHANPPTVVEI